MSNNSLFSTEGKTAIVTGATGYLGQAITEALLESGAKVDIYGRGQKTIDYHSKLSEFYGKDKVDFHMVDLYDEEPYRKALKDTVENNKSVDRFQSDYRFNGRCFHQVISAACAFSPLDLAVGLEGLGEFC